MKVPKIYQEILSGLAILIFFSFVFYKILNGYEYEKKMSLMRDHEQGQQEPW